MTADLNASPYPFDDAEADAVVALDAIERVENPRALMREITRIVRPGGWVAVTASNQLSFASKLSLIFRNQFPVLARGQRFDPGRLVALVESDLRHMATECGLADVDVSYAHLGTAPWTSARWPAAKRLAVRGFSDSVVLIARRV
jgi:SAM-dependent methyltransferase